MTSNRGRKDGATPPAAPRTKRRCLTIVRAIINLALKLPSRPLRFNPLMCVVTPRVERKDKPVFTIPELRLLVSDAFRYPGRTLRLATEAAVIAAGGDKVAAAKVLNCHFSSVYNRLRTEDTEDHWWLFTVLATYTGARASEVQAMEWQWIHWDEGVICLPASCPGNKMRLDRIIPIQPELRDVLLTVLPEGAKGHILTERIAGLTPSDRTQQFQKYIKRCGIEVAGRGPHSLRHNHAAICAAQQVSLADIMRRLGHENMAVSLGYSRTAARFHQAVRGWGHQFFLRRDPPIPNLIQASVIPSISHDGTSPT